MRLTLRLATAAADMLDVVRQAVHVFNTLIHPQPGPTHDLISTLTHIQISNVPDDNYVNVPVMTNGTGPN